MLDAPIIDLCSCNNFVLWYVQVMVPDYGTSDIWVCKCGHPIGKHVDGFRWCTGEVEIR